MCFWWLWLVEGLQGKGAQNSIMAAAHFQVRLAAVCTPAQAQCLQGRGLCRGALLACICKACSLHTRQDDGPDIAHAACTREGGV